MAELLDLLAVYYLAKRYTKRTYGAAYNRYDDGLEQMQRVRDMARKARERREGPSVFGLGERQTRITCYRNNRQSHGKIRRRNCRGQQKLLLRRRRWFHWKVRSATKIRSTSFIVIQVPPILS
jgi:hypothetical protein